MQENHVGNSVKEVHFTNLTSTRNTSIYYFEILRSSIVLTISQRKLNYKSANAMYAPLP